MKRVLVTGAGGFVGQGLCSALTSAGYQVSALTRGATLGGVSYADGLTPHLTEQALIALCASHDAIIHAAGIAHGDAQSDTALLRYNSELTARLFTAAAHAGVGRFVFLSSSKVLGEMTAAPAPVTAARRPSDRYGRSKASAEARLETLARAHPDTRLLIVRPPLVYGPGVRANFALLLAAAAAPLPLPLAAARAPRSFISRRNLSEALVHALAAPAGVYHVADAEGWSTAAMLAALRAAIDRRPQLFSVAPSLARRMLHLGGRAAWYVRLFEPAVLECAASYKALGLEPAPAAAHVAETMRWYLDQR